MERPPRPSIGRSNRVTIIQVLSICRSIGTFGTLFQEFIDYILLDEISLHLHEQHGTKKIIPPCPTTGAGVGVVGTSSARILANGLLQ